MKRLILLVALFVSRVASAQELLGLAAGWKMDSDCELIDVSEATQANGVLVDVTPTTNKENVPQSALAFNLSTSYITLGAVNKLQLADDKSISFWIKPVLTGSTHTGSIFSYGTAIDIRYQEQTGVPKLDVIFGNTSYLTADLTANQWQMITITFKKDFNATRSKVIYYVNGVKTTETDQNKSAHDFDKAIALIGPMDQNTLTNGFRGSLDELKIYSRTLTDAEVSNLALPVTLEYFRAKKENGFVQLTWKSLMEDNVAHFEVQRSDDGINFSKVAQVVAGKFNYLLYDTPSGVAWYRLLIRDRDNKMSFSNVIVVKGEKQQFPAIRLFPNPAGRFINIIGTSGYGNATIVNNAGMIVRQNKILDNNRIDVSGLPAGFYYVVFNDGNKRVTAKFYKL